MKKCLYEMRNDLLDYPCSQRGCLIKSQLTSQTNNPNGSKFNISGSNLSEFSERTQIEITQMKCPYKKEIVESLDAITPLPAIQNTQTTENGQTEH